MNTIFLTAIFGVLLMFSGVWFSSKTIFKHIATACLLILLGFNYADSHGFHLLDIDVTNFLHFSRYGLLFNGICIFSTLLYVLLSGKEIEMAGKNTADCYALIFFVLCGIGIVTAYTNLLMLFIGIEIVSIPLYILSGSDKKNLISNEAALKYFLMGSFSTGILLMGIALLYGTAGTFLIDAGSNLRMLSYLEALGMLMVFIAISFKVSAAPFHFWTPDVYDGAPTVFTSFMATVVKVALFAAFIKLFELRFAALGSQADHLVALIIILTLAIGNLTAVFQQSVKRMLAYSSIAQAGFMMFALYAINDTSKEGLLLYALAYSVPTIAIFSVLAKMNDVTFEGFNGFAKSHPFIAAILTISFLSLAGIPLTAGFFAKYYMLSSVVQSGKSIAMVIMAVLFAAVSVYYYFRVIQSMYFKEGTVALPVLSPGYRLLMGLVAILIIIIGIYPNVLLQFLYF